jgi:hypothetical protein
MLALFQGKKKHQNYFFLWVGVWLNQHNWNVHSIEKQICFIKMKMLDAQRLLKTYTWAVPCVFLLQVTNVVFGYFHSSWFQSGSTTFFFVVWLMSVLQNVFSNPLLLRSFVSFKYFQQFCSKSMFQWRKW